MTPEQYIKEYAPKYATSGDGMDSTVVCKEIVELCDCTPSAAINIYLDLIVKVVSLKDNIKINLRP